MHWRRKQRIRSILTHLGVPFLGAPVLPPGVVTGRHTFGYGNDTFQVYMDGARIEVGAFCSIHRESRILAGSEHVITRASTFPFKAQLFDAAKRNNDEAIDKGTTIIGNDVWIGIGATVLSGVMVGDGAVVGAGAMVAKSVPAYAIVAGNPAQIVRYRFESGIRERLLALAWWEWDDEELRRSKDWFMVDVESFLDEMERLHRSRPESELARRLRELSPEALTPERTHVYP